jgi:hypothetical protein
LFGINSEEEEGDDSVVVVEEVEEEEDVEGEEGDDDEVMVEEDEDEGEEVVEEGDDEGKSRNDLFHMVTLLRHVAVRLVNCASCWSEWSVWLGLLAVHLPVPRYIDHHNIELDTYFLCCGDTTVRSMCFSVLY